MDLDYVDGSDGDKVMVVAVKSNYDEMTIGVDVDYYYRTW